MNLVKWSTKMTKQQYLSTKKIEERPKTLRNIKFRGEIFVCFKGNKVDLLDLPIIEVVQLKLKEDDNTKKYVLETKCHKKYQ